MSSTTAESAQPVGAPEKVGSYRYFVLFVLLIIYTLNFLDRQFLSVLAVPVMRDLHLNKTQLGALTGPLFALFYTVISIPIGMLADRIHRVGIASVACAVWSAFTAACGFATNFMSLAIPRMGVGVGEAGGSPVFYSIVSDYFPPRQRGLALAIFSLGVPFGTMFGVMSGSYIAVHFGWQAAFKTLGVFGLVAAPIMYLVVREPPRGRFEGGAVEPAGNPLSVIGAFLSRPMLAFTALACGLTAFVGYGMLQWAPAFLILSKHMSQSQVGIYYGLMTGITGAIGTFASGWLVDWLGHKRPRAYAMVPAISILLSLPFLVAAVNAPTWQIALVLLAGPNLLNNMYLAPALAVVQNAVNPRQRVVSGAFLLFVLNLVGLGGGPLFVGMMADFFGKTHGEGAGIGLGLLSLAPFFVAAFLVQIVAGHFISTNAKRAKAA